MIPANRHRGGGAGPESPGCGEPDELCAPFSGNVPALPGMKSDPPAILGVPPFLQVFEHGRRNPGAGVCRRAAARIKCPGDPHPMVSMAVNHCKNGAVASSDAV